MRNTVLFKPVAGVGAKVGVGLTDVLLNFIAILSSHQIVGKLSCSQILRTISRFLKKITKL